MTADLIVRLEALTEPDREVDLDIAIAAGLLPDEVAKYGPHLRRIEARRVDPFTASLDAAVALAKAKVPGWRLRIEFGDNYSIAQFVRGWGARKEILGIATSERPDDEICLAICTAALRALEAEGARDAG